MDNNTPKYASWVPTAGGYVADGKVVSTSPQYDELGRFKTDVDRSLFANAQPTASHSVLASQGHQQLGQKQLGISTLNTEGSNQDVNATITGIGSLGSLSENTGRSTTGVLDTQATKSPIAEQPITSDLQEAWNDYDYMVATNNIQGQINALTKISRLTGQDLSTQINTLAQQRADKIQNTSNDYAQRYNEALANGDMELANQILNEQQQWLNSVNVPQQLPTIEEQYRQQQDLIQLAYERKYKDGIDQIAEAVLQLTGNILNFQYNPYTDPALQIAQGYAQNRVKETMNATGMYFSSMTTSAITKAVAELVPVYEKMAKDELRENLSLLQSTANFLMNLEQSEFNMWKNQIELQYEANNEKRKEVAAAWDRANNLGYVDNQASIVLDVPAGTLSPSAREHLQELQESISKENRNLIQNMVLADYKAEIELDRMREQNRLNKDYYAYQVANPKPTTGGSTVPSTKLGGSYNSKELVAYFNRMVNAGNKTDEEIADSLYRAAETQEAYDEAISMIMAGETEPASDKTLSAMQSSLKNMVGTYKPSEILDEAIRYAGNNADTRKDLLNAVTYEKNDESELSGKKMFDPRMLDTMGHEAYKAYVDYYTENDGDATDMMNNIDTLITALNNGYDSKKISAEEYDGALNILNRDLIANQYLDKTLTATKLGTDDSKSTKKLVDNARKVIDGYATTIYESQAPSKEDVIADLYTRLVDKIANTSDKFDYNWAPGNTGKASKTEAIRNIIYSVRDNPTYGKAITPSIYSTVVSTANNLAGQGKINEIDTSLIGNPENTPIVL